MVDTLHQATPRTVLVCGGRTYNDSDNIRRVLDMAHASQPIGLLIHGAAPGADSQAMFWAQMRGIQHEPVVPEWQKHGKAAGPIRNQRMLDEGKPDLVIAFPGGRGTADMVRRAKVAGVDVVEVPASE